jgi:hypothetical protein
VKYFTSFCAYQSIYIESRIQDFHRLDHNVPFVLGQLTARHSSGSSCKQISRGSGTPLLRLFQLRFASILVLLLEVVGSDLRLESPETGGAGSQVQSRQVIGSVSEIVKRRSFAYQTFFHSKKKNSIKKNR